MEMEINEGEARASPSPLKRKRISSGRRVLPLEKIQNQKARDVSFSKRRKGLFHKAYELSVLCGVHVEVLSFSPAGNPFSCAYPSNTPSLFAKVIGQSLPDHESISNSDQTALSQQLSELTTRLEQGKKKKEALQATLKKIEDIRSADVSKMEPAQLEALKKSLEEQVRAATGLSQ